jgi:hypothetical protein
MTFVQQILVQCLAQVDALWEPLRVPMAESWAAVWVVRWDYRKKGLPWRAGGEKEAERGLTALVGAGLLQRRRAARKTTGVKVTPRGFCEGWRLVGVAPDAALELTRRVHQLGAGGRWVRETSFTGGMGWGDGNVEALKHAVVLMRPALARRWVESHCDLYNRVGYRVTGAGLAALAAPVEASEGGNGRHGADPPAPDDAAFDVYNDAYKDMIMWLDSQTNVSVGARGEIGPAPLSTAEWEERIHESGAG